MSQHLQVPHRSLTESFLTPYPTQSGVDKYGAIIRIRRFFISSFGFINEICFQGYSNASWKSVGDLAVGTMNWISCTTKLCMYGAILKPFILKQWMMMLFGLCFHSRTCKVWGNQMVSCGCVLRLISPHFTGIVR